MRPAHNLQKKRGAMFGLDARIALAIFAGLSTVTGATIYKISSQSRITAIAAELNNISKAFGDYMLDVGAPPNRIEDLITSTVPGWNGPYVPYANLHPGNNAIYILDDQTDTASIAYYPTNITWGVGSEGICTADDCWGWVYIGGDSMTESTAEALDMRFDNALDFEDGIFRCEPGVFPNGTCALRLGSVRQR